MWKQVAGDHYNFFQRKKETFPSLKIYVFPPAPHFGLHAFILISQIIQ